MNNRLSFLMSSCDQYEDLWHPFFDCINKFWQDIPYPVYLSTEHKQFVPRQELAFSVKTLNQLDKYGDKAISWSRRFADALNRIESEYVFLVLDDFFCCDQVETSYFEEILDIMDKDASIASFQFNGTRIRNLKPSEYNGAKALEYKLIHRGGWKTHFVPTIWRKSVLLKWLRPWESIWGFEGYGSARARRWPSRYTEKVYIVSSPPIYDYLWIKDCSAVINGKWLNEPELIEFFANNEIAVDYGYRGKMTRQEYEAVSMSDVLKRYTFRQKVVKAFNFIRSYF